MSIEQDRLLTPAQAAEYLGLKVTTIYKWAWSRKVASQKVGGSLRFWLSDLNRFLADSEYRRAK